MKKISVLLLSLVSSLSMAVSVQPCAPSVLAKPTRISCIDKNLSYSIVINTLKSPSHCTGQNYFEYKTASVRVFNNQSNKVIDEADIPHELFSYTLSPATFTSEDPALSLKNCVTPLSR